MTWIRLGSLLMFAGVALGAFGARALKTMLTEEGTGWWQTAVLYHLIHGLGLIAVGWLTIFKPQAHLLRASGWLFVLGIVLFSGSLYLLALTGEKRLGAITPLGGLAFLLGWLLLAFAARG